MRKMIFLDRDGVINHDPGDYTWQISDFKLLDGVVETLKVLKNKGFEFVVISNQGGIAKGLYSCMDVENLHAHIAKVLGEHGIRILDFFYSPNHEAFSRSIDRKPESLLLEKAMFLHEVHPENAYMIGDSDRDVEAAEKLGIKAFKIERNSDLRQILNWIV